MKNTTLVYIEKDGKYLMLHRNKKKNDLNHDKWVGIGGKFEENESPEECLVREVFEETGLTLKNFEYRGIVTFVSNEYEGEYMHLFTSSKFSGKLKVCNEGNLEWIDKDKIYDLPLWSGDFLFLKKIEAPCPFFSMKLVYEYDKLTEAFLDGEKIRLEKLY